MLANAGVLGYMTAAGFIHWWVTALYLLIWALIFWWRGGAYALGILFQVPIYASFIYILLRYAAAYALLFIGWILAALIISWPKFPKVIVPTFFRGMSDMINRRRHPRDIT